MLYMRLVYYIKTLLATILMLCASLAVTFIVYAGADTGPTHGTSESLGIQAEQTQKHEGETLHSIKPLLLMVVCNESGRWNGSACLDKPENKLRLRQYVEALRKNGLSSFVRIVR